MAAHFGIIAPQRYFARQGQHHFPRTDLIEEEVRGFIDRYRRRQGDANAIPHFNDILQHLEGRGIRFADRTLMDRIGEHFHTRYNGSSSGRHPSAEMAGHFRELMEQHYISQHTRDELATRRPTVSARHLERDTTTVIQHLLSPRGDIPRARLVEMLSGNPELMDRVRQAFFTASGGEDAAVRWLTRTGIAGRGVTSGRAHELLASTNPDEFIRAMQALRNGRVREHFRGQGLVSGAAPSSWTDTIHHST